MFGMRILLATISAMYGSDQLELAATDFTLGASYLGWTATWQSDGKPAGGSSSINSSGQMTALVAEARKKRACPFFKDGLSELYVAMELSAKITWCFFGLEGSKLQEWTS